MNREIALKTFAESFSINGGEFFECDSPENAARACVKFLRSIPAAGEIKKIFISGSVPGALATIIEKEISDNLKEYSFALSLDPDTHICVTPFEAIIASDGSVAVSEASAPSAESLLPPVNIMIADSPGIFEDLISYFRKISDSPRPVNSSRSPAEGSAASIPPLTGVSAGNITHKSALTIISGPSKTADIEKQLVNGMHGPGRVAVVAIFK